MTAGSLRTGSWRRPAKGRLPANPARPANPGRPAPRTRAGLFPPVSNSDMPSVLLEQHRWHIVVVRFGATRSLLEAFAGVSRWQKSSCRAECNKAPSMYEMEGALLWPRRTRAASCPASPALRAARQGQAPVRSTGFPVHSHVSGVSPRWCPFPTVKVFLRPPRGSRKGL